MVDLVEPTVALGVVREFMKRIPRQLGRVSNRYEARGVSSSARVIACLIPLVLMTSADAAGVARSDDVRLYAMDCGRLEFTDLAVFSDTGEYDGHPGTLMASCFLVRHPSGDLLWDSGIGDRYAGDRAGVKLANYRVIVRRTLESQLREIGLEFDDLTYFAFSHTHADHVGNAERLGGVAWIVNPKELEWLSSSPTPPRTNASLLAARNPKTTVFITGDHDVFGDGSVKILAAPGHTPGHQVLLVTLANTGAVMLSGDLYHTHDNRHGRRMPIFNVNRADSLASMDRIEQIIKNKRAKLIIQHSMQDFEALPQVPRFMN
jgi:glyoxylase-like metal-dependent hydrolase (beta-lactamase superfamily II)